MNVWIWRFGIISGMISLVAAAYGRNAFLSAVAMVLTLVWIVAMPIRAER
jgi:hypothetical protein